LIAGDSLRGIAGRPRRAPSTISREVAWSGDRGKYRAWQAEEEAAHRARRPKARKLATNVGLDLIIGKGLLRRRIEDTR
jgi:IS30 family transposase